MDGEAPVHKALRIIESHPERAFFIGGRDASTIASAEQALGFRFPAPYREFVENLGAGNFGSFEIYGVVGGDLERPGIPNGVWLALEMRRQYGLTVNLLPVCDLDDGGYYCIERRDADYPIVAVDGSGRTTQHPYEVVARDFGEFFLHGVRQQLARHGN